MRKTLLMAVGALTLVAGCKSYEGGDAATKKIGGIAARNNQDRDKAIRRGELIKARLNDAVAERGERLEGYLARRADVPTRSLERQRAKIADLREDGRELAGDDQMVTDISADQTIEGTVSKVAGDTVTVSTQDGREVELKAVTGSHVVAFNREIPAAQLPVGIQVRASFGSADGQSFYYEVTAQPEQ